MPARRKKPRRPAAKGVLKGYRPEEFYCEMFVRRGLGHTRRIRERLERLDLAALRRRARDALRPGGHDRAGAGQLQGHEWDGLAAPDARVQVRSMWFKRQGDGHGAPW